MVILRLDILRTIECLLFNKTQNILNRNARKAIFYKYFHRVNDILYLAMGFNATVVTQGYHLPYKS